MSLWWKVGFNWMNCFVVILSRIKVVWLLFVELLFDMLICPKVILHLRHWIEILGPHAKYISAHYFITHCSWSVMFLTFKSTRQLPCTTGFRRFFIFHTGILLDRPDDLYSSTTYLLRQAGRYESVRPVHVCARAPSCCLSNVLSLKHHACTLLLFSLLLPASEDASHTVPFITSAYSTNLLSGQTGYEATEVQQISKLWASLALPKKSSRVQAWAPAHFHTEFVRPAGWLLFTVLEPALAHLFLLYDEAEVSLANCESVIQIIILILDSINRLLTRSIS